MPTDERQLKAWMLSGLAGDAGAHAQLLRALSPLMRGFFRRRLSGREDDVEDMVQEVLIAVHTRRSSWDRSRPLVPWLYAIARYKLADYFRQRRNHCPIEELQDILASEGFADACDAQADIDRLLSSLPPKQAAALRATRLEGLSTREAADRIAMSESDVKVSAHRGLKALIARMKGRLQ